MKAEEINTKDINTIFFYLFNGFHNIFIYYFSYCLLFADY